MKVSYFFFLFTFFLISCSQLPHSKPPFRCHINRAAVDIGSGSTKVLIAKVDSCKKKILSIIKEKNFPFKFKESLLLHSNSDHKKISYKIADQAAKELSSFLKPYRKRGVVISGVATEVFRQAHNGKNIIARLSKKLDFPIKVINQKKEALLGFWGVIGHTGKAPDQVIVWDIGAGSMQMTAIINDTPVIYLGKLASVSFKNRIIHFQGQHRGSPNPIGSHVAKWAESLAQKVAHADIPSKIKKVASQRQVVGIGGVHFFSIRKQLNKSPQIPYSSYDLKNAINKRIHWRDHQLTGQYKETEVSNLILVKAFIDELGIKGVLPQKINLATGVLLDQELW